MKNYFSYFILVLFFSSCAHQKVFDEKKLDGIVEKYSAVTPGLVVSFGKIKDGNILRKAYGYSSVRPEKNLATTETIYDIASITKLFTATAIALLVDEKKLSYDTKVVEVIPQFGNSVEKKNVTIEDLLRHKSGLPEYFEDKPIYDSGSLEKTWNNIYATPLIHLPKTKFLYSNTGYMILAKIIEIRSKQFFDVFVTKRIFTPLQMSHSFFNGKRNDCAPTTPDGLKLCVADDVWVQRLGGVAGHDSIFSTAQDLEKFALMWLGAKPQIIKTKTLSHILQLKEGEVQGLGPDFLSEYSDASRGDYFHKGLSFGHTGFTGTSIWMDPTRSSYLIILSNRLHYGHENIRPMRREISNWVAQILDQLK